MIGQWAVSELHECQIQLRMLRECSFFDDDLHFLLTLSDESETAAGCQSYSYRYQLVNSSSEILLLNEFISLLEAN